MDKNKKDIDDIKDMIEEEYLLGKDYYEDVEEKHDDEQNKNAT